MKKVEPLTRRGGCRSGKGLSKYQVASVIKIWKTVSFYIFLHLVNNNTAEFIDLDKEHSSQEYINRKEEKEANEFAANALIAKEAWKKFTSETPVFEETAILSFAKNNKVHPAIVMGRFLFETGTLKVRSSIDKALS